jgi:hypothetical protein
LNRWLSVRFNLLSAVIVGVTGFVVVASPSMDAALAGVALTFAMSVTGDVRRLRYPTRLILTVLPDLIHDTSVRWVGTVHGKCILRLVRIFLIPVHRWPSNVSRNTLISFGNRLSSLRHVLPPNGRRKDLSMSSP